MGKIKVRNTAKKTKSVKINGTKKGKVKKVLKSKNKNVFGTSSVKNIVKKDFQDDDIEETVSDQETENDEQITKANSDSGSESDFDMDEELNKADSDEDQDEPNDSEDEAEQHVKSLAKLKETDPEFYQFLQENDKKLLDFNLSDNEEDQEGGEGEEVDPLHKPEGDLEIASDESDYEGEDEGPKDNRVITLKMLKTWKSDIQTDKTNKTITAVIQAFHAALRRVSSDEDADDDPVVYKVEGSSVFNGVIQLCVLELGLAVRKFLGITQKNKLAPHKSKKFAKIKQTLKGYFKDLLKLLMGVTSSNIQTVLLKHLHYMAPLLVSFPNITKPLLKRLISLWGTADDSVRVVAFFCVLRITNNNQAGLLDTTLKSMYITYVKNSKFVSVNNLASINFMRRSLVEMFSLDANMAYQHVFLYIRQLAIHLRNAITVKKKENIQSVYNWQFVNSLKLWGILLATNYHKTQFQQLVYPLVQVCLGTIKLIPTPQYYPLRFHIIQVLMDISKNTGVYIPILPFILEVLCGYDFNKKHQKVSMKPMNFTCVLRLSKSQLQENGFKDATIDMAYGILLEYLSSQSNSIAFPDLSLLCTIQLRQFLKKSKNANYSRKIKQILEKIEQNSTFIQNERKKQTFNLTDYKQIEGWESQIRAKGTPLSTYYESWSKLNKIKKNKQFTNNEELGEYNLPKLKKTEKKETKPVEGPVELFPSDSEDEGETVLEKTGEKRKRGKRGSKNNPKIVKNDIGSINDTDEKDIVEDINPDDW
ncbi:nucleolar complex protein 2 homolog isoform X2 [Aethina tumida]|uniref:nucleolar complex protein 2 homolog isoform X2 n=1 Tax=Aethina tumida TaxID=116153 RepID=UPI0021487223|nr:nucleolar complex protein 2 homolog isoform X2 [Aethina tumida]